MDLGDLGGRCVLETDKVKDDFQVLDLAFSMMAPLELELQMLGSRYVVAVGL